MCYRDDINGLLRQIKRRVEALLINTSLTQQERLQLEIVLLECLRELQIQQSNGFVSRLIKLILRRPGQSRFGSPSVSVSFGRSSRLLTSTKPWRPSISTSSSSA